MNENLDLCKILKDCPIGTKLYSTLLGDVYLREVDQTNEKIVVALGTHGSCTWTFYKGGNYFPFCKVCLLFPSKDQLDWRKLRRCRITMTKGWPPELPLRRLKHAIGMRGCSSMRHFFMIRLLSSKINVLTCCLTLILRLT